MSEKPILFSGPMVRAILAGEKTQTRRVMKPQSSPPPAGHEYRAKTMTHHPERVCVALYEATGMFKCELPFYCPYGKPGDRLWVWVKNAIENRGDQPVAYRASGDTAFRDFWRPSIHMPRWASRITLEICDVRVQRVQEISDNDAQAEGVLTIPGNFPLVRTGGTGRAVHYHAFAHLWDSINGKREGCSWEANPFCWVIEFKRLPADASDERAEGE